MWRRLASLLCAAVLFLLAGLVVATEVHADLAKKTVIALDPSASAAVPEPMTPALFGGGLVGLAGLLRRQRPPAR